MSLTCLVKTRTHKLKVNVVCSKKREIVEMNYNQTTKLMKYI